MDTEIIQKQDIFDTWKSEVNGRIGHWKETLSSDDRNLIDDYSIASLVHLERYILANYNIDSLQDKHLNRNLDGCVSYIGEAIISMLADSEWHIYLDDKSNIYYGLPCVKTKYSGSICVHLILREILSKNSGQVLKNRIEAVIAQDSEFRDFIKNNPQ